MRLDYIYIYIYKYIHTHTKYYCTVNCILHILYCILCTVYCLLFTEIYQNQLIIFLSVPVKCTVVTFGLASFTIDLCAVTGSRVRSS